MKKLLASIRKDGELPTLSLTMRRMRHPHCWESRSIGTGVMRRVYPKRIRMPRVRDEPVSQLLIEFIPSIEVSDHGWLKCVGAGLGAQKDGAVGKTLGVRNDEGT